MKMIQKGESMSRGRHAASEALEVVPIRAFRSLISPRREHAIRGKTCKRPQRKIQRWVYKDEPRHLPGVAEQICYHPRVGGKIKR
ncbi:hypothetical protein GMOD_00000590 [Pyrenophora seminiperda CCB06]|uniref:Uncharacterized protein n=1 Tax=Pyrenophora seminiperda CCB06 TaxID=1302712 RepID=A0A3M7M7Y4_9PLEO|nr:hypothetical protein GMOD_00000590 [Pyrenophora seminiperda CCB06]